MFQRILASWTGMKARNEERTRKTHRQMLIFAFLLALLTVVIYILQLWVGPLLFIV